MKRKQLARIDLSNPDIPKVSFVNVEAFRSDLRDFKDGIRCWVTIEEYSPKRSLNQNGLFHIWVGILADEIGIDPDDMKYLLKEKFLKVPLTDKHGNEIVDEDGEIKFKIRDTSDLSKAEMSSFMDKVYRWGLDFLKCVLPQPNEQLEIK